MPQGADIFRRHAHIHVSVLQTMVRHLTVFPLELPVLTEE